jgi:hypothetical protein
MYQSPESEVKKLFFFVFLLFLLHFCPWPTFSSFLHGRLIQTTLRAQLPFSPLGWAKLTGSPTWNLLVVEAHYKSQGFEGFVAIDELGDIVWSYNIKSPTGTPNVGPFPTHSLDKLPNGNFAIQTMIADAPLMEITPAGELVDYLDFEPTCGIITHEAKWLEEEDYGHKVLSIMEVVKEFTGLEYPQVGNDIIEWNPDTNDYTTIWSSFEHFDPLVDRGVLSNDRWPANPYELECLGETRAVQDWTHINAVNIGIDDNYLISIRHLNAVVSISRTTYEVQWVLSPTVESDFTFLGESDKFYDQHAVQQLANGDLMMFDNGNERPSEQGEPFSRGLVLRMDYENMTATTLTEFRNVFEDHQGSTYQLGDNFVPIFLGFLHGFEVGATWSQEPLPHGTLGAGEFLTSHIFEWDSNGKQVANAEIPWYEGTAYRAKPLDSIAGEFVVPTFF